MVHRGRSADRRGDLMADGRIKVQLGERVYTPAPQRSAYIEHKLWPALQGIFESEDSEGEQVEVSGFTLGRKKAYEVLALFLPGDFMPEHEFMGFGSADAYEAGRYNEADDKSPTIPEIADALVACVTVNGGKVSDYLKALASPEQLRSLLAEMLTPEAKKSIGSLVAMALESSPSSPSTNGASASTSSTISAPTAQDQSPTPGG